MTDEQELPEDARLVRAVAERMQTLSYPHDALVALDECLAEKVTADGVADLQSRLAALSVPDDEVMAVLLSDLHIQALTMEAPPAAVDTSTEE